ncbi:ribosomal-processing cysteine protease Prp [Streptococcus castoreus]|uniref:ribosomal-processing cysteine protease Prp n=1 Tax=Streptococcus castoreus TaxID=254786 RepID=UPI000412FCC4|nr:ribosomal-processing cysteine protease Prp [Streptococcus castoreus]
MIKAIFTRQKDGQLSSVILTGHAGSGKHGFDIVCASVSTLAINFVNSLEVLANCQAAVNLNEVEGGYMAISIPPHDNKEKVQLLFESFLLGMTNLAENSSKFVQTKVI